MVDRSGGGGGPLADDPAGVPDADLARAWAAGDPLAFGEAYRRFATPLFGTAVGLLGDRTVAADVVHDTFVRAAPRVAGLREPDRLRAWLFAILRNEAASVHRSRRHDGGSLDDDAGGDVTGRLADDAAPADVEASRGELADLVWTAADGLQERDREVLELNVRGGLDTADLAAALGVTPGHAAVLLSRMRDRLERCLGALLMARLGRRDCDALDRLLESWDGKFSLDVRSKVSRHVEGCPRCGQQRARLVTMERLAPALLPPAVLLPVDLHDRLVASIGPGGAPAPAGGGAGPAGPDADLDTWSWQADGFPEQVAEPVRRVVAGPPSAPVVAAGGAVLLAGGPPMPDVAPAGAHRSRGRTRPFAVAAGVLLLALGGAGAFTVLRPEPESVQVVATSPSGPTSSGPVARVTTPADGVTPSGATTTGPATSGGRTTTTTTAPTSRTTTTSVTTTTDPVTSSDPVTSTSTTTTTTTTTTSSPPAPEGPVIQRVSASPGSVFLPAPVGAAGCTPTTTTIVVLVKASGKVTGTASWSPDGGKTSQRVRLSRDGNVLTGSIGEWSVAGTDVVQVVVQDEYGKDSGKTAVTVQRCTRG